MLCSISRTLSPFLSLSPSRCRCLCLWAGRQLRLTVLHCNCQLLLALLGPAWLGKQWVLSRETADNNWKSKQQYNIHTHYCTHTHTVSNINMRTPRASSRVNAFALWQQRQQQKQRMSSEFRAPRWNPILIPILPPNNFTILKLKSSTTTAIITS